jgi:6-phosphogluconolactonase
MRVRVFSDADKLAAAATEEIASWLRFDTQRPTLGLSGGNTPRLTYKRLRISSVPWKRTHLWIIDERHVPPEDPENNGRMIGETLADHVPATYHPVPWHEDPNAAAAVYDAELRTILPSGPGGAQPGLILLGVGGDGHTASLFAGTTAVEEGHRGYVANRVHSLAAWRLTATLPLLVAARRTIFLATGLEKANIVAGILEGNVDCPAARVSRSARDVLWMLDRDAASLLSLTGLY